MMDDADQQDYQEVSRQQFEALGRFVQDFELTIDAIRVACIFILSRDVPQQQLINIVLHHASMTAKPLFDIMRALFSKITEEADQGEKTVLNGVMSQISRDFGYLVEARNAIVHGTWRIGWHHFNDDDYQRLNVSKFKVTKQGLEDAKLPINLEDLDVLSNKCIVVRRLISMLSTCQAGNLSLSGHFVKVGDCWTHTAKVWP